MSEAAPWLKAMENGELGEARAKAFLMDRFWVLERSVDVEGADYLVQQRLTKKNFMDRDPPRLGVVQVKFIQDGGTSISIHKSYVCDEKGSPYNEFFLLVFTGREDSEKSYLLSARDVLSTFREVVDSSRTLLRLGGAKLLATSNFEVTRRGLALDRIEHALLNADFLANRRFLGSTSYIKISADHIDDEYLKPLDNPYGDIKKAFFESKQKLQSVLFTFEEVTEAMQRMLHSIDPLEAMEIYEDAIAQYVDAQGRIALGSIRDVLDEDFLDTAKNHKHRMARLRALGIEGGYFKLIDELERRLVEQLATPTFDASVRTVRVTLTYDHATLRDAHTEVCAGDTDEQTPYVATSVKGRQVVYFNLENALPKFAGTSSKDPNDRAALVKDRLWRVRRPILSEVDRLYLGEELIG